MPLVRLRPVLALWLWPLKRAKVTWLEKEICSDQSSRLTFWQNKTYSGRSAHSWSIVHLYMAVSWCLRIHPFTIHKETKLWRNQTLDHIYPSRHSTAVDSDLYPHLSTISFKWALQKTLWSDSFSSLQEAYTLSHTYLITSCSQEHNTQRKSAIHALFSPITASGRQVVWWFYPAGHLSTTTATLSLPILKEERKENRMKRAQRLR